MSDDPISLNRESVVAAIADYLLQINHRGYAPDRRKVLAVRRSDRTASLRNAATPVRWEVYYFIEGELIPEQGATRLAAGIMSNWRRNWSPASGTSFGCGTVTTSRRQAMD